MYTCTSTDMWLPEYIWGSLNKCFDMLDCFLPQDDRAITPLSREPALRCFIMCEDNYQTIQVTSELVIVHDILLFLFINIYYHIIIY